MSTIASQADKLLAIADSQLVVVKAAKVVNELRTLIAAIVLIRGVFVLRILAKDIVELVTHRSVGDNRVAMILSHDHKINSRHRSHISHGSTC